MKLLIASILCAAACCGQTLHGLGLSSKTCIDLDGDGYGTGPLANLITTSSTAVVSTGSQTITLGAVTGLVAGQRVRVGVSTNMEFVTLTAVSGSTITGYFNGLHASGVTVSAGTTGASAEFTGNAHDDPGCLGLDADDRDTTIHLASTAITKYTPISGTAAQGQTAFLAKLGHDIQVYEWDVASNAAYSTPPSCNVSPVPQNCGAGAVLYNTARIFYLAPASPTAACLANASSALGSTSLQCTGAAHATNSCLVVTQPCLTVTDLSAAGWNNSGVGGDLTLIRDGWNGRVAQPYSGTQARYNAWIGYPGEHAVLDATALAGSLFLMGQTNCPTPNGSNYLLIDGFRLQNDGAITGGTFDTVGCSTQTTSDNHDIWIQHIEGTESDPSGLATITAFNGWNNWIVTYSVLHDDNCPTACNTPHGIYVGSHTIPSSNSTIRRNLIFRNSWNGLHWNGVGTGMYIDQNVVYDNGITGLDFEEGLKNSFIRANLVFNNAKQLVFFDYPGSCVSQGTFNGSFNLCPNDQTGNLIENNTFYQTGNADIANAGSTPDVGCTVGILYCAQNAIEVSNSSSPLAGFLGGNIYRNNSINSYGWNNVKAGVAYGDPIAGGTCGATCQSWTLADTFDHNQFWATDTKSISASARILNAGPSNYTLSTAGGVTAAFTNNSFADPGFVAESILFWNFESGFDFRPLPSGSATLHAGSTVGVPNYDPNGRAYPEDSPSIGAVERNLYSNGWNTLTGAGWSSAVAPQNGAPLDTLAVAITSSTQTTLTMATGAPNEQPNSLMLLSNGASNELVCVGTVSGTTLTTGTACPSGTPSANGRGWGGTTAQASFSIGTTAFNNPMTASGVIATIPANVYPFQTQFGAQANALGAGIDGVLRDLPGISKALYIDGGGHSNYVGNEIYGIFFNRVAPGISRITNPSVLATKTTDQPASFGNFNPPSQGQPLADGNPNIGHISGLESWANWTDSFYKFSGSFGGSPQHTYDSWSFSFQNNTWFRYNGSTDSTAVTTTGTASSASTALTVASGTGIVVGNTLYPAGGVTGIPPGTTVAAIAGTSVTLSQATTGAVSGSITFGPSDIACGNLGTGFTSCVYGTDGRQVDFIGDLAIGNSGFNGLGIADPFTQTIIQYWNLSSGFGSITQNYPALHQNVMRAHNLASILCCGTSSQGSASVFLSDTRKAFYNSLNATLTNYTVDVSGLISQVPTSSPNLTMSTVTADATCSSLLTTLSPGLTFDPAIAKVIGYPSGVGGNTYYLMDPYAATPYSCATASPTGGPPASPSWPYVGHMTQYSESIDATIVVDDTGANVPRILFLGVSDPIAQVLPPGGIVATIRGISGGGISPGIQ